MEITATFANGNPITVLVDAWNVENAIESFFEIGAITVSTNG
jgi:hypothetical protein